jgi:branched-chain amino acid aminotransferase
MEQHYLFNGKPIPAGEPAVGPDNRGLRYGDGLFETIRLYKGRLQLAEAHMQRLMRGMEVLGFRMPPDWSIRKWQEDCLSLARRNGHPEQARVRINVISGDGGLYDPADHLPRVLVQTWPLPSVSGQWNQNGLVLGFCTGVRKSCDMLANLKHNNYLGYVLAARQAAEQHWNDALVLNTEGGICDSTLANIFLVRDGRVVTPSLSEGGVAGIMRAQLIAHLNSRGLPVSEERVLPSDLLQADEVFVTNSIHPIRWVQTIGNRDYRAEFGFRLFQEFMPTI